MSLISVAIPLSSPPLRSPRVSQNLYPNSRRKANRAPSRNRGRSSTAPTPLSLIRPPPLVHPTFPNHDSSLRFQLRCRQNKPKDARFRGQIACRDASVAECRRTPAALPPHFRGTFVALSWPCAVTPRSNQEGAWGNTCVPPSSWHPEFTAPRQDLRPSSLDSCSDSER